jgi:hypothetical protein
MAKIADSFIDHCTEDIKNSLRPHYKSWRFTSFFKF